VIGFAKRISPATVIAALIAVAYAALAYASGGYSTQVIAAVTVAIWWVVIVALATRVMPRRPIPTTAVVAGAFLAAFGALTALSMIWANDAGRAFTEVVRVAGYLGLFVLAVVASARTGARPWLIGLTAGIAIVVAGSLASRFDPSLFGGGDRDIFAALPLAHGRLSYPMGYWNGLGASVALGIVLLGWLSAHAASRIGRSLSVGLIPAFGLALYLTSSRGGVAATVIGGCVLLFLARDWVRILGGFVVGGVGTAALAALASQSDDLGLALTTHDAYVQGRVMAVATVGCIVIAAVVRYLGDGWLDRLQVPRVVVRRGLAALVVAGLVVLALSNPIDRIRDFSDANDVAGSSPGIGASRLITSSGSGRYQFWDQAVAAFDSDPAIGIGAGNYELWWNEHHTIDVVTVDAHSLYLQTLAELGILGLLVLLGFLATVLFAGWRAIRGARGVNQRGDAMSVALALFLAGLASAALDWTWQLPAAFAPVIVVAALIAGPACEPIALPGARSTTLQAGTRRRPRVQFGLGVATLVCAWVAIWVAADQLVASVQLDNSRSALEQGDLDGAAQHARNAAAIQPWSSEAQLQIALVEKEGGDLVAAAAAVRKSIDRAPGDWRPWLVAAEIAAAEGDRDAAQADLDTANSLSPKEIPVTLEPER
jgi:tetratricopeptide (TPR) repeat protein